MTSSLSSSLFRELRQNFFGVLASPSARLYVDVLDALEREAGQRTQGQDRKVPAEARVQGFKEVARRSGRSEKCQ